MKQIPWRGISIGCWIMTFLVVARECVTVGMTWYNGGRNYAHEIFTDPWTYVGMAAVMIGVICCVMGKMEKKKTDAE